MKRKKTEFKGTQFKDNALNGVESVLVVLTFIILFRFLNLEWAIGGTTVASLWFTYSRYRRGVNIGKFLPIIVLSIVARGVIGIIFGFEVYTRVGIALGALVGIILIISALIKRNLLLMAVPYFFDFSDPVKNHKIYIRTLNTLAIALGIYYVLKAGFDFWLYEVSITEDGKVVKGVEGYVIIKFIVGWVLGLIIFWGCVAYAAIKFVKIPNFEGFLTMLERQTTVYSNAIKERFKSKDKKRLKLENKKP